jgi:hypothetical protein
MYVHTYLHTCSWSRSPGRADTWSLHTYAQCDTGTIADVYPFIIRKRTIPIITYDIIYGMQVRLYFLSEEKTVRLSTVFEPYILF